MTGPYQLPTRTRGVTSDSLAPEALVARLKELLGDVAIRLEGDMPVVDLPAEQIVTVLTVLRDDPTIACQLLSDIAGVHWPKGDHDVQRQVSTTGWPDYRLSRDVGMIEVSYTLRSVTHNHLLRVIVAVPDDNPEVPSVTGVYETANFHEREVFDFFGVNFTGHPHLVRILMPDDWDGHPHRKDYPLGGVEVEYKNDLIIPSPHQRTLREVVE